MCYVDTAIVLETHIICIFYSLFVYRQQQYSNKKRPIEEWVCGLKDTFATDTFFFLVFLHITYHIYLLPQAGVPLRLFHKEIEAYLCAEGLFDDHVAEDGNKINNYCFTLQMIIQSCQAYVIFNLVNMY